MATKGRGNPKWVKGKSANPATQFKPGQSGNPGGMSDKRRIQNALLKFLALSPDELKNSKIDDTATRAAKLILRKMVRRGGNVNAFKEVADRAEGKAPQRIEFGNGDSDPLADLLNEFREQHKDSSGSSS